MEEQYLLSSRAYLNSSQFEVKSANINIKYVIKLKSNLYFFLLHGGK